MKKTILIGVATAAVALTSGCKSPVGILYNDTTMPGTVFSKERGIKVGKSRAKSWLGLWATGDAGVEAAMRQGGITEITHVDRSVEDDIPFGIKTIYTTTVYGK